MDSTINRGTFMENDLSKFKRTITSQNGEDGIIAEVFKRIGTENELCVEFGAWDGKHLSNTWNLWHNNGWKAILIEGGKSKFSELSKYVNEHHNVTASNTFVKIEGENSLDSILTRHSVPERFDLLSVDIDGDDYYIFKSLKKFTPRVVVIEFNATIPPFMEVVQETGEFFGASALAILNLAHEKKYRIVTCTETNCILVNDADFHKLGIVEPQLKHIFPEHALTYIVSALNSQVYLSKRPWHVYSVEKQSVVKLVYRTLLKWMRVRNSQHSRLTDDKLIPISIHGEKNLNLK